MIRTIGIIGLGSIGLRHAKNALRLFPSGVIGYDPSEEACQRARDNRIPTIRSVNELTERADALVIATPTVEHWSGLFRAVYYERPVLVEKPLGTVSNGVQSLLDIAKTNGVPVMVGTNLRFHPCVQAVKEHLISLLPNIRSAQFTIAQYNDRPSYLRDGVLLNWGAHEIDLALHLLGPGKVRAAEIRYTEGNDDIARVEIKHDNGIVTSVYLDYITKPQVRTFGFGGNGSMTVNLEDFVITDKYGNKEFVPGTFDQTYVDELDAFIRFAEGGPCEGATGEDGLAVLRIIEEAREKARERSNAA